MKTLPDVVALQRENELLRALHETTTSLMKHLELAIQFGNPFLFENVDEDLDPMLDPVLEKNVVQDGVSKTIMLGDKVRSCCTHICVMDRHFVSGRNRRWNAIFVRKERR